MRLFYYKYYDIMDKDTELGMLSVIITMIVLYLSIWLFN